MFTIKVTRGACSKFILGCLSLKAANVGGITDLYKTNKGGVTDFGLFMSKVTAPQDAHMRLVLQIADWLIAGLKGGARHELTLVQALKNKFKHWESNLFRVVYHSGQLKWGVTDP